MLKPRLRISSFVRHSSTTPLPPSVRGCAWKYTNSTTFGAATVEVNVELLLVLSGSDVAELTEAVFTAKLAELNVVAVTLIVTVTICPLLIVPILHVTVPPACEQVPCVADED